MSTLVESPQTGVLDFRFDRIEDNRVVRSSVEYVYEDFAALADLEKTLIWMEYWPMPAENLTRSCVCCAGPTRCRSVRWIPTLGAMQTYCSHSEIAKAILFLMATTASADAMATVSLVI